ncbi:nucleotide disphospho-sugar-binding domain-containing protein [Kitasatospora cineracea]|nr:nucleotide disphospho-sugar-binding domain-containing protein [Kitasatospora cineracea]
MTPHPLPPLLREIAELLRTVLDQDPAWTGTLTPDTLLDAELHLESHDLAAWSLALRTRYGPTADLATHLTTLDLDALTTLTLADVAALAAPGATGAPRPGSGPRPGPEPVVDEASGRGADEDAGRPVRVSPGAAGRAAGPSAGAAAAAVAADGASAPGAAGDDPDPVPTGAAAPVRAVAPARAVAPLSPAAPPAPPPLSAAVPPSPPPSSPAVRPSPSPPPATGAGRGRFLFVSLPLFGHVHPLAAVARELVGRGHEVVWAGSEAFLRPLVGEAAVIAPIPLRAHRGQADHGMAAARSRWEGYIVPHARHTLPGIERAVAAFQPDVLAVDQHAVAGALAAHRAGLPWASLAPTTMELTRPYRTAAPRVEEWIERRMADMWTAAGLPGPPPHDLRFSPHLLIGFTGEALTGPLPRPDNAVLVGPALAAREPDRDFPWEWLDPTRRQVLVTVGTLSLDLAADFHARMVEALRPLGDRLQAIVAAPDGTVADPPPHVLVRPRVPVLELMPHLDAVVSHGGLNTVCEALAHGVPLLVAPIKGDQPINAAQVAAAGAGRRVRFAHARPQTLRTELLAVLDDPAHAAAARRIKESFAAAGGARAAADHLETLLPPAPDPARPGPLLRRPHAPARPSDGRTPSPSDAPNRTGNAHP